MQQSPLIISVRGFTPIIPNSAYIAPNATIVGSVHIGEHSSVWFQAVIRGDVNHIHIGNNVNIQDGAVVHATFEKTTTTIKDNVSIGHRALIHGCTIEENVLVGMGAIIMDNAIVQKNCLIAAGAVVLENTICESGYIYAGTPAKKVKKLSEDLTNKGFINVAEAYLKYSSWYQ